MKKLLSVWIIVVGAVILSSCGSSKTTTSKKLKSSKTNVKYWRLNAREKSLWNSFQS